MEQEIKQIKDGMMRHNQDDLAFQQSQNNYHDKLDGKLERLIDSVNGLKNEIQSIKTKMSYTAWLTNTSEGVAKIDKTVLTVLLLLALFVLFGIKAVIGTVLTFFNIKLNI